MIVDAPSPTRDAPEDNRGIDGDSTEKLQEKEDDPRAEKGRVVAISESQSGEGVGDEVKEGVRGDAADREREGDDDWEGWD